MPTLQPSLQPSRPPRLKLPCFGMRGRFLSLVLLILVPLMALEAFEIYSGLFSYRQRELQASHELAQAASAAFLNYLENLWDAQLAMGTAITRGLPPGSVEGFLKAQLRAHPTVESLSWVGPDGIVRESTSPGSRGISCVNREHMLRTVAGEDKVVSSLVRSQMTARQTFFVARAIRREGNLLGVMVAAIQPTRLGLVLPVERSGRSNVGVIDRNGIAVYRSTDADSFGVGKPLNAGAPGWKVLRTGQIALSRGFSSPFDQRLRMGAFIPIPQTGWVVGVTAPVDEVLAAGWKTARRNAMVLLSVLALSLLGAFILGQNMLGPISALQEAARSISRGNLKARVVPAGWDEVATAGQAFNQMADRIMELEGDRNRFLETAAYALRNPMSAAKGAIALLRRRVAEGEVDARELQADLTLLEQEVDRLSSQLNEVLDAFCLREGQLSVWREPVELSEVIKRSLAASRMLYKEHRYVYEEKAAVRIFGDARRLEDVFRSLLGNAGKFSPPGTEILVRLEASDTRVLVAVSDQGIGIPEDELDKIFQPFFRGGNLEGLSVSGVGLGLYIAAKVVQDHGGSIRAERGDGCGTTFYVDLPRLSAL